MDWESESDGELDVEHEHPPAEIIPMPIEPDARKRPNTQSVGDLQADAISGNIVDIYPEVHIPTLKSRVRGMIRTGYPESTIIELLCDEIGECGGDFPQTDHIPAPIQVAPTKFIHQSNASRPEVGNTSSASALPSGSGLVAPAKFIHQSNASRPEVGNTSSASALPSGSGLVAVAERFTEAAKSAVGTAGTSTATIDTASTSTATIDAAGTAAKNTASASTSSGVQEVKSTAEIPAAAEGVVTGTGKVVTGFLTMIPGFRSPEKTAADDPIVIPDDSPRGDGPIVVSSDDDGKVEGIQKIINIATSANGSNNNNNNDPNSNNNVAEQSNLNNNNIAIRPVRGLDSSGLDWNLNETNSAQGKGKGIGKGQSNRNEPRITYDSVIKARMREFFPIIQRHFNDAPNQYPSRGYVEESSKILQHLFIGFRKNNLDAVFLRYGRNLTKTVVKIVEALLSAKPELTRLMLSRNPTDEQEAQRNGMQQNPAGRSLILNFDVRGPYTMMIMCLWRRPISAARLTTPNDPPSFQEQATDLDQWINAIFGVQDDASLSFDAGPSISSGPISPQSSPSKPSTSVPSPSPPVRSPSVPSPTPEEGGIECQCCFADYFIEDMVHCDDGHLFCHDCIRTYAQSAISGEGKSTLTCISGEGCQMRFPRAQLETCLEAKTMTLLEEREQEESVRLACAEGEGMEKLAQCPHCPYKCYLPEGNKVIECQNPACSKSTCIQCNQDWEAHCGIPCHEFENKDEESLRLKAEEKMTAALLRVCLKCKTPLIKEEGCNKLTCRCGAKMCYICRSPIKDYSHFCNHPRDPGHGCTKCTKCSLWSNPKEDDERAMEEIRLAAEKEKEEKGFVNDRKIGVAHGSNQAQAPGPAPHGPVPAQGPAQGLAQGPAPGPAPRGPAPRGPAPPGPAPRGPAPPGGNR